MTSLVNILIGLIANMSLREMKMNMLNFGLREKKIRWERIVLGFQKD
jgi:hypothetical protein